MHVVATAGHVDHGKSSLLRALTGGPGAFEGGSPSDRLAEEQRRGLTIDLGYLWTRLAVGSGGGVHDDDVAFVDVPGHERFVPTMLAGVGPVPAVLFVVAADGGWMPQSSEHRDALAALGVRHGVLVLTRSDLADRLSPQRREEVLARARAELAGTSLAQLPDVAVSSTTGEGLSALRAALGAALAQVPPPDPAAPVRLWVDRSFAVRGAGTVVTGTLPAGIVRVGDELALPDGSRAVVRGMQALERAVASASGTARVALNLRGVPAGAVRRGDALSTPGTTTAAAVVDVRLHLVPDRARGPVTEPGGSAERWPEQLVLHLGSAAAPVRFRPLDAAHARLTLRGGPLPLRVGDVGLLRDPGGHRVLAGVVVLDPVPPPLGRRGAARERAAVLAGVVEHPDAAGELRRRRVVVRGQLRELGASAPDVAALASAPGVLRDGEHLLDPDAAAALRPRLAGEVAAHRREHPLEAGPTLEAVRRRLGLPTTGLVTALLAGTTTAEGAPLAEREGRVVVVVPAAASSAGASDTGPALPPAVAGAVAAVLADLAVSPFAAPEAHRLRDLGLGPRELAAAVRVGALARVADGVYLAPEALDGAAAALAGLPQPFAMADARRAWGTSRRVAVPLLELLDRRGATRRLPDSTRTLTR